MAFTTPYDIANRALQHLGVPRIVTFADASRAAPESGFLYDKVRRDELRRFVWTFATRRTILRPITATTENIIPPTWAVGTTYAVGDIVLYQGQTYVSLTAANTGNVPGIGGTPALWFTYFGPLVADNWSGTVQYIPGDLVVVSNTLYLASAPSLNHTPPNVTYWVAPQGITFTSRFILSADGYNPPSGLTQRTLYALPANYLRMAPQDPKQPAISRLGTTAGMLYNDWEIEAGYLASSSQTGGLILRFVSDTTDVAAMETMFCESLSIRMALELNEILSQKPGLHPILIERYKDIIDSARMVSAIEGGNTEPDIPTSPAPQGQGAPAGQR